MKPYLSVVIPAYNEATNFKAGVIDEPIKYLKSQKYSWELIFVDDGSTDETFKLLSGLKEAKLIRITHGGKAAAVTAGVLASTGQIIIFTDFDQSTPLSQVERFIASHKIGSDVCIGIRTKTQNDTVIRKIRSWAFVSLVQLIALPGIKDSQCGFKSFTNDAARKIFSSLKISLSNRKISGGYMGAFDVEVLFLARKFGYKIDQIPVRWIKFVSDRLNIWKEPLQMVIDTIKVRLWDILGKYGN